MGWQAPPAPKTAPQPSLPVNAALAGATAPRPVFRGQAPEPSPRTATPLVLPTPEALGLAAGHPAVLATAPEIDWNDARVRLRRLGAVGFHLDQTAPGQWRATLLVPLGAPQPRHVEANAATDAAALADALRQAELLAQRP